MNVYKQYDTNIILSIAQSLEEPTCLKPQANATKGSTLKTGTMPSIILSTLIKRFSQEWYVKV